MSSNRIVPEWQPAAAEYDIEAQGREPVSYAVTKLGSSEVIGRFPDREDAWLFICAKIERARLVEATRVADAQRVLAEARTRAADSAFGDYDFGATVDGWSGWESRIDSTAMACTTFLETDEGWNTRPVTFVVEFKAGTAEVEKVWHSPE